MQKRVKELKKYSGFSQRIPVQIEAAEKLTVPRIEPLCALFRLGRDASSLRALQGMGQKMC